MRILMKIYMLLTLPTCTPRYTCCKIHETCGKENSNIRIRVPQGTTKVTSSAKYDAHNWIDGWVQGAMTRSTATTKMNEISSRSHAVFIIIAEQVRNAHVPTCIYICV
jgi:hypothetical protein